ncbi:MAG TPA: GNAT family N-acetyltransferase [Mogibacterium sp.]|nr:GNAT family N-acetyltransferase [Mogibacterium sp.]
MANEEYGIIREATMDDLEEALALQDSVYQALENKNVFAPTTREELIESLKEDRCFCVIKDGEMAAFSILVSPRISDRNFGTYLGYDDEKLLKTASVDTCYVSPKHRGKKLQQKLILKRLEAAREEGATEALTTVDPTNSYSFNNLKSCGMEVAKEVVIYGGLNRYIMRVEL